MENVAMYWVTNGWQYSREKAVRKNHFMSPDFFIKICHDR